MFDLVTVGHFAIDSIRSPRIISPKPTLGGPPTYVSLAAAKLGAKVAVISEAGRDFQKEHIEWLRSNHVDLSGLRIAKKAFTTRFELTYLSRGKRVLRLKALAPPISTSDVPNSLSAKGIHVAPIAGEVSDDLVMQLRKFADLLSLDPQGFVRSFISQGKVSLKSWRSKSVLEYVDIYKSSEDEIKAVTGTSNLLMAAKKIRDYGVKIVIITRGVHGSMLFYDDALCDVPPCKSRLVLDPTGAGDAFIGAFLAEYVLNKDPFWCACVGSAAASFVVEGIGPERFGERQETYERAKKIYEKQPKNEGNQT